MRLEVENNFREFWIIDSSQLNGQPQRVYNIEPKWLINIEWTHAVDIKALESANAELSKLKELVQEYSINAEGDDAHLEKIKEEMQFKIISLSTDLKASETSRAIVNLKLELANAEIAKLRGTLEEIGADMYVGYKKFCGCADAANKALGSTNE